ncbi:hypothetical protein U9M48_016289 [Paspalum notatum var. saurae]|uniref:Uncharacterized protein n=1 Tax=Paspalum notatum var. saurae TaxID=547442 RepID=A0AAQ3T557_PASNO
MSMSCVVSCSFPSPVAGGICRGSPAPSRPTPPYVDLSATRLLPLVPCLLTTGWSNFITTKKLLLGDNIVVFLRGEDGRIQRGPAAHQRQGPGGGRGRGRGAELRGPSMRAATVRASMQHNTFQAAGRTAMAAVEYLPDKEMSHHQQPPTGANDATVTMHSKNKRRLDGKVAIVTGGGQGVGEAIVRTFVEHGARVVIADIADAAGKALASSLGGPQACSYEHCDVSVEADVERTVRGAVARHGRLDVLCNNAAGEQQEEAKSSSILSLDAAEFERVLRVNALGAALGVKHAAGAMVAARRAGSIVSVGSVAGVMGGMGPHADTASKHALAGLTKNAACELGPHGIRVNCISPLFRVEDEEVARDVAEAALFLASDESRYVSGHNLVVDGGVTTARNVIGL